MLLKDVMPYLHKVTFGILLGVYAQISLCMPTTINVGGYLFPPFVDIHGKDVSGLTIDLIELFNQTQTDYQFQFILTSPKRRYRDFERGLFDVLFFENKKWSWQDFDVEESKMFLSGGEVFITQAKPNRTQDYFIDIKSKQIVAILGFHYNFADNITDIDQLSQSFNIRLVNSPNIVINQVANDISEVGITTFTYLKQQIKENPALNEKLLVSEQFDQTYQHKILIRNNYKLTPAYINNLLDKIANNGTLDHLLEKYGL